MAFDPATVGRIKRVLRCPGAIAAVCRESRGREISEEDFAVLALTRLGQTWEHLFPMEHHPLVNLMIEPIDLVQGGLRITWRERSSKELLGEFRTNSTGAEQCEWT